MPKRKAEEELSQLPGTVAERAWRAGLSEEKRQEMAEKHLLANALSKARRRTKNSAAYIAADDDEKNRLIEACEKTVRDRRNSTSSSTTLSEDIQSVAEVSEGEDDDWMTEDGDEYAEEDWQKWQGAAQKEVERGAHRHSIARDKYEAHR